MFGIKTHVYEAPLAIGAVAGGLLASSGAIAGLSVLGGITMGAMAGGFLGGSFSPKTPKVQSAQDQQSAAAAQTPALPPASQMPATPMTPTATPDPNSSEIPAGDASTPTADEIARGELDRKRRGRLSTILTTPQSRLDADSSGNEKLGG